MNTFFRCLESRIDKNNTLYGKFSLDSIPSGQGNTFANSLRRSLLSDLSGLAITHFCITSKPGLNYEFATLPGLTESVLDFSLNLKKVVLSGRIIEPSYLGDTSSGGTINPTIQWNHLPLAPIGFLKVKGPAILRASDLILPSGIRCVHPNQYLGTLAVDGALSIKFLIAAGKNFIVQDEVIYNSLSRARLLASSDMLEKQKVNFNNEDIYQYKFSKQIKTNKKVSFNDNSIIKGSELRTPQVYTRDFSTQKSLLSLSTIKVQQITHLMNLRYYNSIGSYVALGDGSGLNQQNKVASNRENLGKKSNSVDASQERVSFINKKIYGMNFTTLPFYFTKQLTPFPIWYKLCKIIPCLPFFTNSFYQKKKISDLLKLKVNIKYSIGPNPSPYTVGCTVRHRAGVGGPSAKVTPRHNKFHNNLDIVYALTPFVQKTKIRTGKNWIFQSMLQRRTKRWAFNIPRHLSEASIHNTSQQNNVFSFYRHIPLGGFVTESSNRKVNDIVLNDENETRKLSSFNTQKVSTKRDQIKQNAEKLRNNYYQKLPINLCTAYRTQLLLIGFKALNYFSIKNLAPNGTPISIFHLNLVIQSRTPVPPCPAAGVPGPRAGAHYNSLYKNKLQTSLFKKLDGTPCRTAKVLPKVPPDIELRSKAPHLWPASMFIAENDGDILKKQSMNNISSSDSPWLEKEKLLTIAYKAQNNKSSPFLFAAISHKKLKNKGKEIYPITKLSLLKIKDDQAIKPTLCNQKLQMDGGKGVLNENKSDVNRLWYKKKQENTFSSGGFINTVNNSKKLSKKQLIWGGEDNSYPVLPLDVTFTPVSKVNFQINVNRNAERNQETVILEVWTNGSITPKRALQESSLALAQDFYNLFCNVNDYSNLESWWKRESLESRITCTPSLPKNLLCIKQQTKKDNNQLYKMEFVPSLFEQNKTRLLDNTSVVPGYIENVSTAVRQENPLSIALAQAEHVFFATNEGNRFLQKSKTTHSQIKTSSKVKFSENKNIKLKQKIQYLHTFWRLNISDLNLSLKTQLLLKKLDIHNVYDLHFFILKKSWSLFLSCQQKDEIIKIYLNFGFNSPF